LVFRRGLLRSGGRAVAHADAFNGRNETIAAASQGLNESGTGRSVSQGFADAIDRGIHAVFVIDECSIGPQLAGYLLACEELTWAVHEQQEHLEWLRIQLDAEALPAKLARVSVCFECSEAIAPGWPCVGHV
jgi:hypothetical protein